jgi:PAS domain S-box-containing protein
MATTRRLDSRDVTARRQAEEALRISEERLRLTLDAADMGTWEWNIDADVSVWNAREYSLLGLNEGEVDASAATFLAHVHPEDRPALEQAIARAIEVQGAVNEEFRIVRSDGQTRWVQSKGRFLSTATGTARHMLGLNFDITARKALEAALKEHTALLELRVAERTAELRSANERLQQEMARRRRLEAEALGASEREQRRIGHDLHDGLCQLTTGTVLLSKRLARVLREKALPREARLARQIARHIESVADEARRLSHGLSPVALESDGLAAALGELARTTTRLSHIPCVVSCAPDVSTTDHTVDVHLFRIAQEAVNNAVRHSGASHIEIAVRSEGGSLALAVADDGCGIPRRASRQRGLGLRLMHYRAEMIGGTLRVERARPRGTLVRCVIPASGVLRDARPNRRVSDPAPPTAG